MNDSTFPKILLIVDLDPNGQGAGELYLRELASRYPAGRLFRYSLAEIPVAIDTGEWIGFPSKTHRISAQTRLPFFSSLRLWHFILSDIRELVSEIEDIVKDEQIDLIWSVLNSAEAIYLTRRLKDVLDIPIVTTVWDTPEHLANGLNIDAITTRLLIKRYSEVLSNALRISVMSERTQSIFKNHYKVNSIIMRHGIHPDFAPSDSLKEDGSKNYVIGFAGNLYCKKEWNALIQSIDLFNAGMEQKKLKIRFIGRFPRFGAKKPPYVEFAGTMSLTDTIKSLRQMDVAYVPYWFDYGHSQIVKTAFPSKISAYVAAGVPILYHGPKESTPTDFMDNYKIGLCCHSLNPGDILQSIRSLLLNQELRNTASLECHRALKEELGLDIMLERFAALIGINPKSFNSSHDLV